MPWDEPTTLEALQDRYIFESKFSARSHCTTLILVGAKKRDGSVDQVVPGQRFKLFLVTWQDNKLYDFCRY